MKYLAVLLVLSLASCDDGAYERQQKAKRQAQVRAQEIVETKAAEGKVLTSVTLVSSDPQYRANDIAILHFADGSTVKIKSVSHHSAGSHLEME